MLRRVNYYVELPGRSAARRSRAHDCPQPCAAGYFERFPPFSPQPSLRFDVFSEEEEEEESAGSKKYRIRASGASVEMNCTPDAHRNYEE